MENTTIPSEIANNNECEPIPTPEKEQHDDAHVENFNFPSLIETGGSKHKTEALEKERRGTPEIILIDDESSEASSPVPNGQSLPKLNTLESGKETEFGNRRRPPLRRPTSRRRKRNQLPTTTVSGSPKLQSPMIGNKPVFPSTNLLRKPLTPIWNMIINFPKEISNEYKPFHDAMCEWQMETIDEINIPVILRESQKFVAYSVAHIKLFSKFPTNVNISQYIPSDVTLESLPMTEKEAWMMNFINTILCNYELGMQIFQNGDNLVELRAIELYYWFAKKHYLEDLLRIYDGAVPQEALTECKNIIGAIFNLKKKILNDLKKINEQIKIKYRSQNQLNYSTPTARNQVYLSI
jgi:hypothetical protein